MKWALALALAVILLVPLSTTAMTPSYRGFAVPGPGGDYGVLEEHACTASSTHVLLGPVSFCLPCGFTTLGAVAFVGTAATVAIVARLRRKIEDG